jgi:nicotinate-nucleotide adenylyltransferase
METIGILGGSFDPIHIGHLITAQVILEKRNLSKIIFVPCYISPHKIKKGASLPYHRLKMAKLAIKNMPYFEVSDIELKKEEISFTIDTLREMKNKYENIELIIGFDNILKFDKWKNPDEIFDIAKVIVMNRKVENNIFEKNKYYDLSSLVDTPIIEISSTKIRERIKNNLPVDFYLPEKVKQYIYKNKLYI